MKTFKKNIINDTFPSKPTRFGRIVVETANHENKAGRWRDLYDIFLNTAFWLPVLVKNNNTKKETYFPVLMVHKNGKRNLVIFEKKSRLRAWHKKTKHKVRGEVAMALCKSGYEFLRKMPLKILTQHDLYIDYGKNVFLVFKPKTTVWLQKTAERVH